ncbi:MAG: hypothetical protein HY547_02140 [Elusimicrobia bacterium]|nr:hypothetical protein [Elusimicrobiota bacterium]
MTKKLALGTLAGGAILFIWGAVCWMALPFHNWGFREFVDPEAVALAFRASSPESGVYLMPYSEKHGEMTEDQKRLPFVLATFKSDGIGPMGAKMLGGFAIQCLGAFLVTWLLFQTKGLSYWKKVSFVATIGATVWVLGHLPYWNWWGFTCAYTAAYLVDLVGGWFLAGLAIAKFGGQPS